MKVPIKVSKTMDSESSWNEYYENRIVRVPLWCRDKYGLTLGNFHMFREKDGSIMILQIAEALLEDLKEDQLSLYVTSVVFDRLCIYDNKTEVERVCNITLGCDPEFFLVDKFTGNTVMANRFVPKQGAVGHDGMLMEIRPYPSTDENVLTSNINALLKQCRAVINSTDEGKNIVMVGASCWKGLTAGFHLHYGLPSALLGRKSETIRLMTTVADYYIGIPSIIPEGNEDCYRRVVPLLTYGKPGGYRIDNQTFEFRLPGGSCLRHPILTRGLIALGAIVVEDFVSRLNAVTDHFVNLRKVSTFNTIEELYPNIANAQEIHSTICNIDITPARSALKSIIDDVRKMVGYKDRASSVEPFFACITNGTKFSYNIEDNWGGFNNEEQQKQMVFLQTHI